VHLTSSHSIASLKIREDNYNGVNLDDQINERTGLRSHRINMENVGFMALSGHAT
jgi:hypothetical protein